MGGATVITNLFSAVPYLGSSLVTWLWGGFAVDNPTLTRFFTFHFLIPFVVSGVTIIHIFFYTKQDQIIHSVCLPPLIRCPFIGTTPSRIFLVSIYLSVLYYFWFFFIHNSWVRLIISFQQIQ